MTRLRTLWVHLTDPLVALRDRARCVLFGLHGRGCRGRADHRLWERGVWRGRGRWIDYSAPWRWWAHDAWHSFAYWVRPFDQLADGRRWRWQRPAPCGRKLPPHVRASLQAWADAQRCDRARQVADQGRMTADATTEGAPMTIEIDPETLRLRSPEQQSSYSAAEWSRLGAPGCPVCGTPVEVECIAVPTRHNEDAYIPGRWQCPGGCNPVTGERGSPEERMNGS